MIEVDFFAHQVGVVEDENQCALYFHRLFRRSDSSPYSTMRTPESGLYDDDVVAVIDGVLLEPEVGKRGEQLVEEPFDGVRSVGDQAYGRNFVSRFATVWMR